MTIIPTLGFAWLAASWTVQWSRAAYETTKARAAWLGASTACKVFTCMWSTILTRYLLIVLSTGLEDWVQNMVKTWAFIGLLALGSVLGVSKVLDNFHKELLTYKFASVDKDKGWCKNALDNLSRAQDLVSDLGGGRSAECHREMLDLSAKLASWERPYA